VDRYRALGVLGLASVLSVLAGAPQPVIAQPAADAENAPAARADQREGQALAGSAAAVPPAERVAVASEPPPSEIVRIVLGLVAILGFAYVAGSPRLQAWQHRLGVTQLIAAGLPFVVLGAVARHPSVGVLTEPVMAEIRPFVPFGLGWIGFALGARFDLRQLVAVPREIVAAAFASAAVPFATIAAGSAVLFLLREGYDGAAFVRSAVLLATAGVIGIGARGRADSAGGESMTYAVQLQELAAIVGLFVLAAVFRPEDNLVGWRLPGIAWGFLTLGMGAALGIAVYVVLAIHRDSSEIILLMLGFISLIAGLASFLRLSPITVGFLAGALAFNLSSEWSTEVRGLLERLERPVYLVFLVVAGALWRPWEWEGWALLVVFVVARFAGKAMAPAVMERTTGTALTGRQRRALILAPISPLAVAVVVNAQDLYAGPAVSWLLTAVVGGAVVTELIIQVTAVAPLPERGGQ
jgi:Kef-type K+ transport system membrane component KefB